jgi:pSer/pThr/pTyr-binding forkhead associated (FHA) protein
MNFSLIVTTGATAGKEIPIRMPEFIIGRDPECHLRPASPLISKKHCAFINLPDKVILKDFGSTNGSFVNEVRVVGEQELKDGDTVKFGPLLFRAKLDLSSVKQKPVPSSSEASTVVEQGKATTSTANAAKKSASAEDDIAAMLFNFADPPSGITSPENIPLGSTIAGLAVDSTIVETTPLSEDDQRKADEEAKRNANRGKVQDHAATSKAAQAILDKYMRRPR